MHQGRYRQMLADGLADIGEAVAAADLPHYSFHFARSAWITMPAFARHSVAYLTVPSAALLQRRAGDGVGAQ